MKKLYLSLFLFLCFLNLRAQNDLTAGLPFIPSYNETDSSSLMKAYKEEVIDPEEVEKPEMTTTIATDRPDQTECPFIVPVKMFQIETGYQVEYDKNASISTKNNTYNTTLIKYGVSKQMEFRLIAEYLGTSVKDRSIENRTSRVSGMNSITVGAKIFICNQRGWLPKTSLITHLELPYFGSSLFRVKHLAPRFRFLMQHTISERVSFSYNIGGEWDGSSQDATLVYTASLGIGLVRNLGMFIEAYGFVTENSNTQDEFNGSFTNDHRFDGGFTYLLNSNLQLDVSGGIGVSKASPDSFLSCGVSWRFAR
jgi:hypothetical protein